MPLNGTYMTGSRAGRTGRLTRTNRYAVLYRVHEAKRTETRARRIKQFVEMLARGDTPHPQKRKPE